MKSLILGLLMVTLIAAVYCEKFKCTPNVRYIENNCNKCTCSEGSLSCTFRACFENLKNQCKQEATWIDKCNQCWCTEEYGSVCTDYDC